MEARCYGFAKRFQPFLVNTVVGFIGPEYLYNSKQVIRAGLEDHFMGKLTGIPMGCDACYTNHMKPTRTTSRIWPSCSPPPGATTSWASPTATT